MSKKVVRILTMLGVIFFLFMGKAYDYGAESQHGVPYSTGYVVDGKYNSAEELLFFMALEEYVVLFLLEHF